MKFVRYIIFIFYVTILLGCTNTANNVNSLLHTDNMYLNSLCNAITCDEYISETELKKYEIEVSFLGKNMQSFEVIYKYSDKTKKEFKNIYLKSVLSNQVITITDKDVGLLFELADYKNLYIKSIDGNIIKCIDLLSLANIDINNLNITLPNLNNATCVIVSKDLQSYDIVSETIKNKILEELSNISSDMFFDTNHSGKRIYMKSCSVYIEIDEKVHLYEILSGNNGIVVDGVFYKFDTTNIKRIIN